MPGSLNRKKTKRLGMSQTTQQVAFVLPGCQYWCSQHWKSVSERAVFDNLGMKLNNLSRVWLTSPSTISSLLLCHFVSEKSCCWLSVWQTALNTTVSMSFGCCCYGEACQAKVSTSLWLQPLQCKDFQFYVIQTELLIFGFWTVGQTKDFKAFCWGFGKTFFMTFQLGEQILFNQKVIQ